MILAQNPKYCTLGNQTSKKLVQPNVGLKFYLHIKFTYFIHKILSLRYVLLATLKTSRTIGAGDRFWGFDLMAFALMGFATI